MSSKYSYDNVSAVYMSRSKLNMGHRVKTSMRVGDLVPIDVREVLPGDNWSCNEGHLVRLSSAYLRPVMDKAFMDVYEFFVPLRLLYDNYEGVFGNSSPNAYVQEDLDSFPSFTEKQTVSSKTVADYLGLPVGEVPSGISVLKFRAFALIYEEWFRNQNTVNPMLIQKGDFATSEKLNNAVWSPSNYTGKLPKVPKKNDYFTSCLPAPQKGAAVNISLSSDVPVFSGDYVERGLHKARFSLQPTSPTLSFQPGTLHELGVSDWNTQTNGFPIHYNTVNTDNANFSDAGFYPANLWAKTSELTATDVNDLRFAFQLQKMLERDARGGGRYREYLLSHYGVRAMDARMQVPEFLGGRRTPLNLQQVAQTSAATTDSPLASLGGYSQTLGRSGYRKAFDEHGFIFTVACIRYEHSYQQGIDRSWFRNSRNDFYDPLFANLGEQPVWKSQLYGLGIDDLKGEVFGYQEAWADYRNAPDIVTGEMRSSAQNSFDVYHFADNYSNAPVLSQDFTDENPQFFRRTTAVGAEADVDDFLVDFYFDCYAYRVMPVRSIPGLIDHH